MKGRWGWDISSSRLRGVGIGGAPSLGTLLDKLGRYPDTGIFHHGGPVSIRGEPGMCGGASYTAWRF
jgi:hypothetical protein